MVGHDDNPDIVQGIVLMRYGGETQPTLEGIHKKADEIQKLHLLPPGVEIKPYYDRGDLVKLTTHTVLENLIVGMGLVAIVLFLFLGSMRACSGNGFQYSASTSDCVHWSHFNAHFCQPDFAGSRRLRNRR